MVQPVAIDMHELTITPVFMMLEIENIPKSETAGHAVMEMHEIVEVRFAGNKSYIPRFPADAFWRREGNREITYAERWADQYRDFKSGNPQEAMGTPLEMLRPFGVTPEQLSLCRALRIYSIEALHALEGPAVKTMGMNANALKTAASRFMAERNTSANAYDEIGRLQARIAELESRSTVVPEKALSEPEIDAVIKAADDAYAGLSDTQIKDEIAELAGERPRGNPSRATLVNMLDNLKAA